MEKCGKDLIDGVKLRYWEVVFAVSGVAFFEDHGHACSQPFLRDHSSLPARIYYVQKVGEGRTSCRRQCFVAFDGYVAVSDCLATCQVLDCVSEFRGVKKSFAHIERRNSLAMRRETSMPDLWPGVDDILETCRCVKEGVC